MAYHGVGHEGHDARGDYDPHLLVSPEFLRRQVHLLDRVCVMRLSRDTLVGREQGARLTACLTFDDGLRSVYDEAMPILKDYAAPATLFVNDSVWNMPELWHDTIARAARTMDARTLGTLVGDVLPASVVREVVARLPSARSRALVSACKSLEGPVLLTLAQRAREALEPLATRRYMNRDELVSWAEAGHEVGGHTTHHMILEHLSGEDRRREVEGNKSALEEVLGQKVRSFAYPNGEHSLVTRRDVGQAGYEVGWSVERPGPGRTPMALPRRNISDAVCVDEHGRFSGALFWVWLFGRHRATREYETEWIGQEKERR